MFRPGDIVIDDYFESVRIVQEVTIVSDRCVKYHSFSTDGIGSFCSLLYFRHATDKEKTKFLEEFKYNLRTLHSTEEIAKIYYRSHSDI